MLMIVAVAIAASVVVMTVVEAVITILLGVSVVTALWSGFAFAVVFVPVYWVVMIVVERRQQRRLGISVGALPVFDPHPIYFTENFDRAGSVASAVTAAEDQITTLKGRVRREPGQDGGTRIIAAFGSRLTFRMFGISSARGRRQLPMKVVVEVQTEIDDAERARITINSRSDSGWYLVRLPSVEVEYNRALRALVTQLRHALLA